MIGEEKISVLLIGSKGHDLIGSVTRKEFTPEEKKIRGRKFWAISWGLCIFSITLPLLHFILVPGFFIAGPVSYWLIQKQKAKIIGGEAQCTNCNLAILILPHSDQWPLTATCKNCQEIFSVKRV